MTHEEQQLAELATAQGYHRALFSASRWANAMVDMAEKHPSKGSKLYLKNLYRASGALSLCRTLFTELEIKDLELAQYVSELEQRLDALRNPAINQPRANHF